MVPDKDLGWLAGIIDGEGCFSVNFVKAQERFWPRCDIVNTNVAGIERIRHILSSMSIQFCERYSEGRNRRPRYTITILARTPLELLVEQILPHLTMKKGHADVIKAMLIDYNFCNPRLVHKLRELNQSKNYKVGRDEERFKSMSGILRRGDARVTA